MFGCVRRCVWVCEKVSVGVCEAVRVCVWVCEKVCLGV